MMHVGLLDLWMKLSVLCLMKKLSLRFSTAHLEPWVMALGNVKTNKRVWNWYLAPGIPKTAHKRVCSGKDHLVLPLA